MVDGVRLKGLKELDRALGRVNKDLRSDLRGRMKEAAQIVANEGRAIAQAKGLRVSGDLIRGIKPFALTGRAGVRSSARHGGYAYPSRLEYEGRGASRYGPRASLIPAFERKEAQIIEAAEDLLGDIERDWRRL